jgi:hypothetical protein
LLSYFTAKQLWALGGAIVGLVVASFGAGVWLTGQKHNLDLASERGNHAQQLQAKEDSIRKLTSELENATTTHKAKLSELEKLLAEDKNTSDTLTKERAWFGLKAEFLEHYLRYELAMAAGGEDLDRARSLFVSFVHRLWRMQEDNAVRAAMGVVAVPSNLPVVTRPSVQKPANVQQRVIKTVTFPDKSSYTIPYEIASAVHRRE